MAVRVPLNHVSRAASGSVPATASMFVHLRGTTTQQPVFAAATGGSALSQPISPNAEGNYTQWVDSGRYDYAETQNGTALPIVARDLVAPVADPWTNLTLINSWVTFGGAHPTPAYTKTADGFVKLRGVIKSGAIGTVAATLPVGFRPTHLLYFPAPSGTTSTNIGAIEVQPDGDINILAGVNTDVSLSSIFFLAA